MMTQKQVNILIHLLKEKDVIFGAGLKDEELDEIHALFGIRFPEDLKQLLQTALPISGKFVEWRAGLHSNKEKQQIELRINAPLEGLLFDVKNNGYWHNDWGYKPNTYTQQKEVVNACFERYPTLIPVYSHRYISDTPQESGNPIFSVHQTDIIYYGNSLADYFAREFRFTLPDIFEVPAEARRIEFWSDFVD